MVVPSPMKNGPRKNSIGAGAFAAAMATSAGVPLLAYEDLWKLDFQPSSIGLTVLLPRDATRLQARVRGDGRHGASDGLGRCFPLVGTKAISSPAKR